VNRESKAPESDHRARAARSNIAEALTALSRLETQAVPALRTGDTTEAGACFRRVSRILAGKERVSR